MPVLVRVAVQHDQAMPRRAEDEALARDTRERGTEDALPLLLGGADVGHPPGRPQDVHAVLPCWSTPRLRRRWLRQAEAETPEAPTWNRSPPDAHRRAPGAAPLRPRSPRRRRSPPAVR